jgi:uncharacterized protein (TIGR00251 family)
MPVQITLYVQPGAKKTEVVGLHGDHLKIRLQAPPVDNQANLALTTWLAKKLNIRINELTLIRGEKNRLKTFEIHAKTYQNLDEAAFIQALMTQKKQLTKI